MPASSSTMTSSHRLARSEPGTFVCANSSTAQTCGRLARIGVRVHLLEGVAPVVDAAPGDHLQPFDLGDRVLPSVRLEVAHDDVASLRPELLRLLEHPEGLPDTRGVPQEHLEPAAPRMSCRAPEVPHSRGNTRTSMPSASRIRRSTRFALRRASQPLSWLWPTKIWVMPCRAANSRIARDRVSALQDLDPCARLTRRPQVLVQDLLIRPARVPAAGRGPRRTLRESGRPVGARGGS